MATSGTLAASVQRGHVGKFKALDFLDSAVLEHGQVGRGCRFATSCSGQICFASKTCNWNPVQIGVAGQPLASELGWFDQCSWLLFNPNCSVGLWQICNVATLPGDSFAWQQVGNLQCQCSMQHGQDSAAWLGWLQICNILQWPHLFCNQDLQFEPCADWCSWAASGSDLGWFDQCSWLLST